jgi:ABC-type polysaccharide/polyol phosphate export permease
MRTPLAPVTTFIFSIAQFFASITAKTSSSFVHATAITRAREFNAFLFHHSADFRCERLIVVVVFFIVFVSCVWEEKRIEEMQVKLLLFLLLWLVMQVK